MLGWVREEVAEEREGTRFSRFVRLERAHASEWFHLSRKSHNNVSYLTQAMFGSTAAETNMEEAREVMSTGVHRALAESNCDLVHYRDIANALVRDFMAVKIAQVERERGANATEVPLAELNRCVHQPTRPGFWRRVIGAVYNNTIIGRLFRPAAYEGFFDAWRYIRAQRANTRLVTASARRANGAAIQLVADHLLKRELRQRAVGETAASIGRLDELSATPVRYHGRESDREPAALLDGEVFDEVIRRTTAIGGPPVITRSADAVAVVPPAQRKPVKAHGKAEARRACGRCARLAPILGGYKWPQGCCPACHQEFAERTASKTLNAVLANNGFNAEVTGTGFLGAEGILLEATPKAKELREGACMYPVERGGPLAPLVVKHLSSKGLERRVIHGEKRGLLGWTGQMPALPQLAGIGFLHTPSIMAKTDYNLDIAVMNRLCAQPPVVATPGFWEAALAWVKVPGNMDVFLPGYDEYLAGKKTPPMSFEEWVSAFPPSRQKMFRRAMRDWIAGKRPTFKQMKVFSVFVKRELANNGGRVGAEMPKSNPRSICNPIEMTHVLLGRFLRPITTTAKVLAERGPITYDSRCPEKLNDKVSARWIHDGEEYKPVEDQHCPTLRHVHNRTPMGPGKKFVKGQPTPVLYTEFPVNERVRATRAPEDERSQLSSDYSMMDSSYGQGVFKWLEKVLITLGLPCGGLIYKLWKSLAQVSGTANGKQFTAGWINASGRDDTALINFLVNQFLSNVGMICAAMDCSWETFFKMKVDQWRHVVPEYAGGAVGDDLYVDFPRAWEERVAKRFEPVAIAGGFTNKIEFTRDITHLVFLGNRPYPTAVQEEDGVWRHRLRWGKQLGRCLYKLGWQRMPSVDCMAWVKGVAWATLISNPHVPVLRAYAISVLEQTEGVHMRVPQELWKFRLPATRKAVTVTPYTFRMMEDVYGLSAREVAETEDVLLRATLGEIVNSHGLMKIFSVDAGSM
jgi:hypothetical protein